MKDRFASVATAAALWVLVALLLSHALLVFPGWGAISRTAQGVASWGAARISTGDVIAAIGALATLAAIVVALWIAVSDRRRQDKREMAGAHLAAAGMVVRLAVTREWVASASMGAMFHDLTIPEPAAKLKSLVSMLEALKHPVFRPSDETLLALTPLANNCASRIARAYDEIENVRNEAASIPDHRAFEGLSLLQHEGYLSSWGGALFVADQLLRVALNECESATELGAPMPSGQELYGDPTDWETDS